jgi:hypothetical protein
MGSSSRTRPATGIEPGLEVNTERLQTTTRVTLEWSKDDKTIVCDQDGMGDNPWADDVVRELG